MITPLPDHTRIDRHFAIELFTESAKMDIRKTCKEAIESSNRSFGQMIRHHRERMERVMTDENIGDDAGFMCSGLRFE
jgi:hypothetical protein